jgi:hypothetical protein
MDCEFTIEGMRRLIGIDDGPCFCVAARMAMEPDGREVAVQHVADPEGAKGGTIRFILPAPPGGGYLRSADLLAEDGTAILRVTSHVPTYLPDGGSLLIPVTVS